MMILEQSDENSKTKKTKKNSISSRSKKSDNIKKSAEFTRSDRKPKEVSINNPISELRSIFKNIPLVSIEHEPLIRKSISIDGQVYDAIKHIKVTMSEKSHGRFTFNMVIQSLLQDHVDLQNLKSELNLIKKEMEATQTYLKDMLKLALTNSKPQVQYIPVGGQSFIASSPLSPPEPPHRPPKKINYKPPNTGNLMKDYVKEIKQLFKGDILRPSDVVGITKVKHKDSKVKELKEDCLIPDIELVSVAKNFKPIIEEESNV